MRLRARHLLVVGGVALTAIGAQMAPAQADSTVLVTQSDIGHGWYRADTRPGGSGTFEAGPATPPLGTGSFHLSTTDGGAKAQLLTDAYDGVALADLDGLTYQTYRDGSSTGFVAGLPALNLRVDIDHDGVADRYFVYEPYQSEGNAAVHSDAWQQWDAIKGGAAKWWSNGASATTCDQDHPCTWTQLLGTYPFATIAEGPSFPGSLGLNQGSGNPGIIAAADALSVTAGGHTTTYDFEPGLDEDHDGVVDTAPPTSKDQCKNGGFAHFDNPSFRNQGQCVSSVVSAK